MKYSHNFIRNYIWFYSYCCTIAAQVYGFIHICIWLYSYCWTIVKIFSSGLRIISSQLPSQCEFFEQFGFFEHLLKLNNYNQDNITCSKKIDFIKKIHNFQCRISITSIRSSCWYFSRLHFLMHIQSLKSNRDWDNTISKSLAKNTCLNYILHRNEFQPIKLTRSISQKSTQRNCSFLLPPIFTGINCLISKLLLNPK